MDLEKLVSSLISIGIGPIEALEAAKLALQKAKMSSLRKGENFVFDLNDLADKAFSLAKRINARRTYQVCQIAY